MRSRKIHKIVRDHDALFRFVFGEPEQMADLLRACLPAALAAAIDWSTLAPADGSFVDEELQDRQSDVLFTVGIDGVPALLYVLAEHKSRDHRFTAWQLARYVVRVLDRWLQDHPGADALPAVLPFVLHHGDDAWRAPRSPRELVDLRGCRADVAALLRPLQLDLPFVLLDLAPVREQDLEAMRLSAVTGLTLRFLQFLRRQPPAEAAARILGWQHLVAQMLGHPRGRDVLVALFSWWFAKASPHVATLRAVMTRIRAENPPMRSALDLLLEMGEKRGERRGERRGEKRGEKRGVLAGQRSLLAQQLAARFGAIPEVVRARLAAADARSLRRWGRRVLTAPTLAAVFAAG